jgi:SSS family solute:Na+ symporter
MLPSLILSVVFLYFTFLLVVSYFTSRKATNEDFFVGGRKSSWLLVSYGMIGASLSGITFISVPGWVLTNKFAYMQMVLGYVLGYFTIANVLLPVYYKLNLTSIYTYLERRFGSISQKTGSVYFLISRLIGASLRLFVVASVLQFIALDAIGVPFWVTITVTIMLIWLYTYRGGIKTIVWTDTLQTTFMLAAVVGTFFILLKNAGWTFHDFMQLVEKSGYTKTFFFDSWKDGKYFWKQFISGAFITIVMTGLDQDMMQKNLSCKNLKEAKQNMYLLSVSLVIVNFIFLMLGALLVLYANKFGINVIDSDNLYPAVLMQNGNVILLILFVVGLVAAAFSSADSALTALTTSFTIDILEADKKYDETGVAKVRILSHLLISSLIIFIVLFFAYIKNDAVISSLFKIAGYTYGPLLGLYSVGLFTKLQPKDKVVPFIAIASPLATYGLVKIVEFFIEGYKVSYEVLIINGLITFVFLWLFSTNKKRGRHDDQAATF